MSSRTKNRWALAGIVVLAALAVLTVWPNLPISPMFQVFNRQKFHLGLDLQGGTQLVYRANVSQLPPEDVEEAVAAVRDTIERRVNIFGVSEPVIQTTKVAEEWRVIVELPGVKDIHQAIQQIGETPLLEFREPNNAPPPELSPNDKRAMEQANAAAKIKAEQLLRRVQGGGDFAKVATENSEDPGSGKQGGDLGFFGRGIMVPEFEQAAFALKTGETSALVKTQFGFHIIKKEEERKNDRGEDEVRARHILILTKSERDYLPQQEPWQYTGLTGKQLKRAQVVFDQTTGQPQISLQFNEEGSKLFADITARNISKPVAIFLDGGPISTPIVQQAIQGGQAVISGNFSLEEAKLLAQRLNSGALPVPIVLISQQNVGPSLGQTSIDKSLLAGKVGLGLVILFMIIIYRLPGVISVATLLLYAALVLALFKTIPVTLTLAGIAGFILSIGMAVDANVLIFERLKEELRNGKPVRLAIQDGFSRAWTSIRDGNLSTLITCVILYWFGSSLLKGFGLTLALGILVSMFSAIVVGRVIFEMLPASWLEKHAWLLGGRKVK